MSGLVKANNNKNYTDEWYTPEYAIIPILKYLKPNSIIWAPFDSKESNYVKILEAAGHKVYATHINNGNDFFKVTLKTKYDYIISNPPYSIRNEILKKLYEIGKPFAMLLPLTTMETPFRSKMFQKNGIEILAFDKRVNFIPSEKTIKRLKQESINEGKKFKGIKGASMNTSYFCKGILPEKLIFHKLERKNTNEL